MPLPTAESVDSQKIREVRIRAHAPAKGRQRAQYGENVLESLRSGWVADYEAAPGSKRPRAATRRRVTNHPLQMIASELRLFFQSMAEMLRELVRSIVRGALEALKTDSTGPALIGMFAVIIAIGGLVYITLVDRIFDQGQPSASAAADSAVATAPVAASTPAPLTAENAPVAAAPAASASDQPASALFPSVPQSPTAAPALGGLIRLPADFTKSDGTSALDISSAAASASSADGGDLIGLANSRTADTIARKAHDAPAQRDPGAAASSSAAYATPASRTYLPASGEQRASSSYASSAGVRSFAAGESARRPVATDARTLAALESAQRKAARAGSAGEVESTAVAAIAHGGQAVFDVRHVRATNGEGCPARIVVTAATLAFLPDASCETGAFTIPLASVTAVETGPVTPQTANANLLNIEYSVPGKRGGRERLRLAGSPSHGGSAPAAPVTPIRNVIVAVRPPAVAAR